MLSASSNTTLESTEPTDHQQEHITNNDNSNVENSHIMNLSNDEHSSENIEVTTKVKTHFTNQRNNQAAMRKEIINIQKSEDLDTREKARLIQALISGKWSPEDKDLNENEDKSLFSPINNLNNNVDTNSESKILLNKSKIRPSLRERLLSLSRTESAPIQRNIYSSSNDMKTRSESSRSNNFNKEKLTNKLLNGLKSPALAPSASAPGMSNNMKVDISISSKDDISINSDYNSNISSEMDLESKKDTMDYDNDNENDEGFETNESDFIKVGNTDIYLDQEYLPTEQDKVLTYFDVQQNIRGCKHYQRNIKLQAACCGRWFPCRFCHDEISDHNIVRRETKLMMCMACFTVQRAGKTCCNSNCQKPAARYYCDVCKLWDDAPGKGIYHCDKCGICRIGTGLGIDYFHCDTCDVCMAISLQNRHKCIERNLESDCPICGEYLFTSTMTVIFMPCGHCIHYACHREYIKSSFQCPTCFKALADMSEYYARIDELMKVEKMPIEYSNRYSLVYCNDCEEKHEVSFHFVYHKCPTCKGYNTKVLDTYTKFETAISENPVEELSSDHN